MLRSAKRIQRPAALLDFHFPLKPQAYPFRTCAQRWMSTRPEGRQAGSADGESPSFSGNLRSSFFFSPWGCWSGCDDPCIASTPRRKLCQHEATRRQPAPRSPTPTVGVCCNLAAHTSTEMRRAHIASVAVVSSMTKTLGGLLRSERLTATLPTLFRYRGNRALHGACLRGKPSYFISLT